MAQPDGVWIVAGGVKQDALVAGDGDLTQIAGNQYNYQRKVMRADKLEVIARPEFVTPLRFDEASEALERYGVAVIRGEGGSGRRTAAVRLLHDALSSRSEPSLHPRELIDEWDRSVEGLPEHPNSLFLLDLGLDTFGLPERFGRELVSYGERLHDIGSRIVVIATPEQWRGCIDPTDKFTVDLERPPAKAVAIAHLEHRLRCGDRRNHLDAQELQGLLNEHVRPRMAVRVAEAIATADDRAENWLRDLVQRLSNWPDYLAEQFESEQELVQRVLMLAIAVRDGDRVENITSARDLLLEKLDAPYGAAKALVQPSLSGQLKAIDATYANGTASLTAGHPGRDQAVFNHVWLNYPEIRQTLLAWMGELAAPDGLATTNPERIAAMLVALAEELYDVSVIKSVVNHPNCRRLAEHVVVIGACHPVVGQGLRRTLRDWARSGSLHSQEAVLRACRGRFGTEYPDLTLTRIRWLLESSHLKIRAGAADLLRSIAGTHPEPRALLDKVKGQARRRMFAALITPGNNLEVLRALTADSDLLATEWRELFDDPALENEAVEAVLGWIRAHLHGAFDALEGLRIQAATLLRGNSTAAAVLVAGRVMHRTDGAEHELWLDLLRRRHHVVPAGV
ncbi:hypothetical protein NLX83_22705 [Allokutzneria sp. A3M-2-11 16]|uniref:hypothetical protein n=1 Tax=Allokutzneria sp. A3M-2-11 16 TaxID=2962043 RepID=UPI0020B6FCE8|nr:hypothetical protein [Allokutzneria sp. A3M-2-11 16]MCP3802080.1 hypothetical protein [Allokutzneria sp. A3M-2-11 16]